MMPWSNPGYPVTLVEQFVDCINAGDATELAHLITADHRFIDSLGFVLVGKEAVQRAWRAYFRWMPDYQMQVDTRLTDGPTVVLLGQASGRFTGAPDTTAGRIWQTHAAWRALVRDGLLAEWQVYADNEPLRRLMRSEPEDS